MTMQTIHAEIRVFHTSPQEIKEIRKDGRFDDVLFFSDREYSMGKVRAVYSIDLDERQVINGRDLEFTGKAEKKAIKELIAISDKELTKDEAFELLTEKANATDLLRDRMDPESVSELSFDVQRLQGRIASEDGFQAFRGRDEQGTVYIVPMSGKLDLLKKVR